MLCAFIDLNVGDRVFLLFSISSKTKHYTNESFTTLKVL